MIRLFDRILSVLAAALTVLVTGIPLWAAFVAVQQRLVPIWVWAPMIALGFVGVVMTGAFLRKAGAGIHPMRERRR